jgi:hypothetical protein
MQRQPISIRPTAAQMAWLQAERRRRGLAINALVVMALEAAMAADAAAPTQPNPDGQAQP